MFLFDDREGHEKIINLDNLVSIEIMEDKIRPDVFFVFCIMTDGRRRAVHQDSKEDCVKIVDLIFSFLASPQQGSFRMSQIV